MAKIVVRKLQRGDVEALVGDMRDDDMDEAIAAGGPDIAACVQASVDASPLCRVIEIDGVLAAIMGAVPLPNTGMACAPWLLGTNTMNGHPGALTRLAKRYCALTRRLYPVFINVVYAESARSIRWLERLGFSIDRTPLAIGANGQIFYRFSMGLDHV